MELKLDRNWDLEKRKEAVTLILKDKSKRIVIHISIKDKDKNIINWKNNVFIIPIKYKICNLMEKIRHTTKLNSDAAIYIYKDSHILKTDNLIKDIYDKYRDEDGALYLKIDLISTFGIN